MATLSIGMIGQMFMDIPMHEALAIQRGKHELKEEVYWQGLPCYKHPCKQSTRISFI